jgi:hypothetical protein
MASWPRGCGFVPRDGQEAGGACHSRRGARGVLGLGCSSKAETLEAGMAVLVVVECCSLKK